MDFNTIFAIILTILAGFVVYMQLHVMREQREKRHIPLFWEKKK